MKDGWNRYASKERYKQKGYLRKHCDGGSGRKAREASRCDSIQHSRESKKEETTLINIGEQNEECRKKESIESSERGQEGIQGTDQGRSEISQITEKEEREVAIQSYGKVVLLKEQVVPNEPFPEDQQLALDIYEKALRENNDKNHRSNDTQSQDSDGVVLDTQPIPGKRTRRRRKKNDS